MLHMTEILRGHPDVLADYHRRFRYILVDEYQDTNLVQYLWLRLLAQGHRNICCVGDDDQSIYSWRGAEVENILRFEKDFPRAPRSSGWRATTARPRRSSAAASGLIAHNDGPARQDAAARAGTTREGEKVTRRRRCGTPTKKPAWSASGSRQLQRDGHPLAEIAILVRAGFQTRAFEERLITLGVPYRVVGGLRFYERAEIRDAIAYMRVLAPAGRRPGLRAHRQRPAPRRRRCGAARDAREPRARRRIPLARGRGAAGAERRAEGQGARGAVGDLLQRLRPLARGPGDATATWWSSRPCWTRAAIPSMWKQDKSPEAPGRLENLKEFVRALADFETLAGFLEHVALVMENDENADGDRLSLMTLHAAKGLEFDTVFLPGWEEGLFPHASARMDEGGEKGLEEERRLAYVGLTRARQQAIVSSAANRRIYGNWQAPSPAASSTNCRPSMIQREGSAGMARNRVVGHAQRLQPAPARPDGAQAPHHRGRRLGGAGAARPCRAAAGRRAGLPQEIRLWPRHRRR